jgi:hypothetical protein
MRRVVTLYGRIIPKVFNLFSDTETVECHPVQPK